MLSLEIATGWGDARYFDIGKLLIDAASHVTRLHRTPFTGIIQVEPTPDEQPCPITYYRASLQDPFVIQLSARNKRWSQFAYQFAHELCHVLCDYERLRESLNGWLHEAICELASVFTLRRMAERWPISPPYPNWVEYGEALSSYAEERLHSPEHQLSSGVTLAEWLALEEEGLRQDRYQRDKNAIVAFSLLPIFESEPTGWNAVRNLPASSAMVRDYLREWHSQVDLVDKPFVARIMQLFEE